MSESPSDQVALLQEAIAALQSQRAVLGDAVVEASLVALRAQLAQAQAKLPIFPEAYQDSDVPKLVSCLVINLMVRDRESNQGQNILDYGFKLITEIVRQHNGMIKGLQNSYLIAIFSGGADDPIRATNAALDMRQRIYEYTEELEEGGEGTISFRAGLNIGMLALSSGPLKGLRSEMTTVEVAGMLAQSAPPNGILLSQQLYTYLADDFNLQSAAAIEVSHKRIATWRLIDSRQTVQVQHQDMLPEAPFMGRSQEVRTILQQIQEFATGSVIVISGECGLGKSRLLAEVQNAAPMIQWLVGYCQHLPIKPAYSVWNDLLLRLIDMQPTSDVRDLEKRLREWLSEHGLDSDAYSLLANQLGLITLEDSTPEGMARQTFETWKLVLTALVRQHPTVIVFEEAQAMDTLSLALLEVLVEALQTLPVAWMLVTQPLYDQPAATTVNRLGRLHGYTYLGLEPLDDNTTQSLLYGLLQVRSLPDPVQAGIIERAQGNPLFLQQILRTMIERNGLMHDPNGRWVATIAALQDQLPMSLGELIQTRLQGLPPDAQQLLQLASVAGDLLFSDVLRALSGTATQNTLNLLYDRGLLRREPQYMHPTIRETIYQGIPKQQRATLHRQVAAILSSHCELEGPWLVVRAYHMDRGLQTQGALDTYNQAKDWAYNNNALIEVSEILGSILDLLNERDAPEQVAKLLVEQQDVLYQINPEDPRCKVLLNRAYSLWSELGNTCEAASVLLRLAVHHADSPREDDYYREAQMLLEREDARHEMLPGVYLRRALYLADQGSATSVHNAEELFERARALALQLQDVNTLAHIHFEMGLYLRDHQQLSEALAAFQQALSYFSQLEELSADERVLTCNYLADLYYHLGQPTDGEYFALEAVASAAQTSDLIQILPYITLSECYAAQARWQDALQTIDEAPADFASPEMPLKFWQGRWKFEGGDTLVGLEMMREALPTDNLECVLLFIDYLLDANFVEEASIRLHQLVKQGRLDGDNHTTIPTRAFYDRLRGRLAAASKDYARAISLLDRAMRQFARDSFVLLSVSTHRAYALALLARGNPGDKQAARALVDEAIATCKKLSIHAEHRRLQQTIREYWSMV